MWPFKKKCQHEFDYMRDMTPRNKAGFIACPCHKCGRVFMADCGLNLPGKLVQLNKREGD